MGRRITYKPEYVEKIKKYAEQGFYQYQIAKKFGIAQRTLTKWLSDYPELREAYEEGRGIALDIVENAVFKRAVGYKYKETTLELVKETINDKKPKYIKTKEVTKHLAPDVTAGIFMLKNLRPEKWSDKKELEISTVEFKEISVYSDEDLDKVLKDEEKNEE